MAFVRRKRTVIDAWPGWVDALSTLLIIIIFVLLVFILGQGLLGQALQGRDNALAALNAQMASLSEMLNIERKTRADLEITIGRLSTDLQSANQQLDVMAQIRLENDGLTTKLAEATTALTTRNSEIAALNKSTTEQTALINKQAQQLALLAQNIKAMVARVSSLNSSMAVMAGGLALSVCSSLSSLSYKASFVTVLQEA